MVLSFFLSFQFAPHQLRNSAPVERAPVGPPRNARTGKRRQRPADGVDEHGHVGSFRRHVSLQDLDPIGEVIAYQHRIQQLDDDLSELAVSISEMSAFGGSDLKLPVPSLQNGMNAVVFILPAIRSGRSVK